MICDRATLADFLGKSPRHVGELLDGPLKGAVIGGGGRGSPLQIDSARAIELLITHKVSQQFGDDADPDGEGAPRSGSKAAEELRLARAKADEKEIHVARLRGESVPLSALRQVIMTIASEYVRQLDGLAARNASDFADCDDAAVIRDKLLDEARRIRAATADQLLAWSDQSHSFGGEADPAEDETLA